MNLTDLINKQIAIVGYGMEGRALANYLLKHNLSPTLIDELPWEEWPEADKALIRNLQINFIFGPHAFLELGAFDVIFRSPGVSLAKLKDKVQEQCIITSQTQWFFEHCPGQIIGITGTKGKGTTASLIYEILKHNLAQHNAQAKVFLTGNIGQIQPAQVLAELKANDYVVYELSSFQLQDLHTSPHIAVILMVTSDHLDYHKNLSEYYEAKSAIAKFQTPKDFCVINADVPASVQIGDLSPGQKIFFSRKNQVKNGCFFNNQHIVFTESNFKLSIQNFLLKGQHNIENISAAILVARLLNVGFPEIETVLQKFKGLEHRLELVTEKNGVKYYNDSFSTTPETAIAGINAFTEPLIVILGGSSKNADFKELGQVISETKNVKAVILIGEEAKNLEPNIRRPDVQILKGAQNMGEIFKQIRQTAKAGDVVLLSPACASFGMFKNYKERGEQFKKFAINE